MTTTLRISLTPTTEFRTQAVGDENLDEVKVDDIIQIDPEGIFPSGPSAWPVGKPLILFNIPTGKNKVGYHENQNSSVGSPLRSMTMKYLQV